ncbi:MAG: hypothetical protein U0794_22490 [Isosphaeraceae bacterium]
MLAYPPLERRSWTWSIGPAFISLFLWVGFFDQFPRETLTRGTIGWTILGAGIGGGFAFLLFYLPGALWGYEARRSLSVLATRTFGLKGAGWLPPLLTVLIQIVWLTVAVRYGTRLCLSGLVLIRMLTPGVLEPWTVSGATLPSPLFLATSLIWTYFIALAGRYLVRVIAALMNVYPVVVALILALGMGLAFRGLPPATQGPFGLPPGMTSTIPPATAAAIAVQLILGFFATAGLVAADWGAVCRTRSDVTRGGLVSVALACWIIATIATLTVVGSLSRRGRLTEIGSLVPPLPLSYEAAIRSLFNDWIAGGLLLALSLTALAPGCYAAFLIGTRLHERFPRRTRTRWTLTGALLAYVLLVLGVGNRLSDVFVVTGGVVAPLLGAIAADFRRSGGRWDGPRVGWNRAGLVAWLIGAILGVTPWLIEHGTGRTLIVGPFSVLFAYAAAFLSYLMLASMGWETRTATGLIPVGADPEPTPASSGSAS